MSDISEIVVRVPACLEDYRAAVGKGLFYLTIAQSPPPIPEGKSKPMRIKIPADSHSHLKTCSALFGSDSAAIVASLSWVHAQPAHTKRLLLSGLTSSQTQGETHEFSATK